MDYKKRITAAKIAAPALVITLGSTVVQWAGNHLGFDVSDDLSYKIITGVYSVGIGISNWWKNRKKKSY